MNATYAPERETGALRSAEDAVETPSPDPVAPGPELEPEPVRLPVVRESAWRGFALAAGAVVGVTGLIVLTGWMGGIDELTRPLLGETRMRANTALGLVLLGASVVLVGLGGKPRAESSARRRFVTVAALTAAVIGAVTLAEYVLGVDTGFDNLLSGPPRESAANAHPNRPSSVAALMLLAAGLSLAAVFRESRRAVAARQWLALICTVIAYFAALSYAYSADAMFNADLRAALPLSTAIAFLLAGPAILCLRPYEGWMRILTADTVGSFVARRLLPAVVAIVFVVGMMRVIGTREGVFDDRFGSALAATLIVAISTAAIAGVATTLNRLQDRYLIAESERRGAQLLLEGLFDASDSVIAAGDARGRVLMMNKAFERMRGIPREQAIGRTVHDFLPAPDVETRERMVSRVTKNRERLVEELVVHREDASPLTLNVEMFPMTDENGELADFGVIATDVTDRKHRELRTRQLNAQLEIESERAGEAIFELESFAHTISHDLRSPLRAIDGYSQVIEAEHADAIDERGRHFLERIREGAEEMTELINGLLEFSRIGRSEMKFSRVDMTEAARHANALFDYEREGRDVRVTIHDLPPARADARLIGVVFANLLSNAHKYSRRRVIAEIEVGVESEPGRPIAYFVRDNGVGFDMKQVDKIFGTFERLHTADEYEGLGIGMATVQRIVRRHGGRIWAHSEPDAGTTMYFELDGEDDRDG
ncbi:MAG: PAS domain-containing protein [Actinobacteria bacterium]|nr:PAS domain-containing protein [Actinomycetota bacterium]